MNNRHIVPRWLATTMTALLLFGMVANMTPAQAAASGNATSPAALSGLGAAFAGINALTASAQQVAGNHATTSSSGPQSLAPATPLVLQANPVHPTTPDTGKPQATITNLQDDHIVDLGQLHISPVSAPAYPKNTNPQPNGGAIGTQNAYMVASPDVVSRTTTGAFGTLTSGWTPGETVNYTANGAAFGSFARQRQRYYRGRCQHWRWPRLHQLPGHRCDQRQEYRYSGSDTR